MEVRLEIVAGDRRMAVHAMVAAVQHGCAGLREAALRAQALDLCRANPQIRLKGHRQRNVPTLFGTGAANSAGAAGEASGSTSASPSGRSSTGSILLASSSG